MGFDLKNKVLKALPTRVWRTYSGGSEIDKWLGHDNPTDGDSPEVWVASTVKSINSARKDVVDEGLSKVLTDAGDEVTLKELIESDPEGFLGEGHYRKYGTSMAVLTKIIDSLNRLAMQVHPDKQYARSVLNSDYGKTEAWFILGGRKVNGEDPYVLMGFKPGITRDKWKALFDSQDIQGMIDVLHKVYVKPGEVYFIDGGVPHAIYVVYYFYT